MDFHFWNSQESVEWVPTFFLGYKSSLMKPWDRQCHARSGIRGVARTGTTRTRTRHREEWRSQREKKRSTGGFSETRTRIDDDDEGGKGRGRRRHVGGSSAKH